MRHKNECFILACYSARRGDDDSFDEAMERSRQRYLQDEVDCLERTLAKRQAQLREAERMLKDTNSDLKEAKEQVNVCVNCRHGCFGDWLDGLQVSVCVCVCVCACVCVCKREHHSSKTTFPSYHCVRTFLLLLLRSNLSGHAV